MHIFNTKPSYCLSMMKIYSSANLVRINPERKNFNQCHSTKCPRKPTVISYWPRAIVILPHA